MAIETKVINEIDVTQFKDDGFDGNRQYTITLDGTPHASSTIIDTTTYTQQGTVINAELFKSICNVVNKINTIVTVDLDANSWSGSSAPYTQTFSHPAFTDESTPVFGIVGNPTALQSEAFNYITSIECYNGGFKVYCNDSKPGLSFTIQLKGM